MKTAYSKWVWTVGLMGVSAAALAGEPKTAPPQEPAGFITGGVIGGLAAGPVGAVIGAGIGTWLGNRVHRAGEAAKAEAQVAALRTDELRLQAEVEAAQSARNDLGRREDAKVLDGLQGDVLFRTGSAELTAEMANGIHALAEAVAKSPALKVRVDGYADPRGTVDANLKLSEARADAVRDVFLGAGVDQEALEVNAYGKSQSVADDIDGYALERRVRLTLQARDAAAVAQTGGAGPPEGVATLQASQNP